MKNYLLLLLLVISFSIHGQTNNYKITYLKSSNGKLIENQEPILVFTNELETVITNQKIFDKKAALPFEVTILDRKKSNQIMTLGNLAFDKKFTTIDSISLAKQNFEFLNEKKTILGYTCKKVKTIINSNTIEIWYTNDLSIKGAPTTLGQNLGLVLEMNRNNNFIITATKIEKIKSITSTETNGKLVDLLTYRDLLWKSRFTTIPIFKDQIINFSDASKSNDTVLRFANGTIALRKIKFPEIKLGSQIFVDLQEQSNAMHMIERGRYLSFRCKRQFRF